MTSAAERAEFWVGSAVIAVAAGFLAWSFSGSSALTTRLGKSYELRAAFPNVDGIEPGTDIRIGGVKVGRVSAVQLNPESFLAEASFSIPQAIQLPPIRRR
ncbi:MlaD family protein [Paracoccus cavernae]|uniref:MlaD family protein n=1 Tax=Paracoccus cavernae TaxID=1571207 RepID=UPI00363DD359